MKKGLVLSSVTLALFFLSSAVGADIGSLLLKRDAEGSRDKSVAARAFADGRSVGADTYRSPGALRKVVISSGDADGLAFAAESGAVELGDYGSFKLYAMNQTSLDRLTLAGRGGSRREALSPSLQGSPEPADGSPSLNAPEGIAPPVVRDDLNVLMLRSGAIDTTADGSRGRFFGLGRADSGKEAGLRNISREDGKLRGSGLRLVQFVGPVKREWLEQLRASGLAPIAYVPNNAYLVRAGSSETERLLKASREAGDFVQWEGPFVEEYKIHPGLRAAMMEGGDREVTVAVQLARGRDGSPGADLESAKRLASSLIIDSYDVLSFTNLKMRVSARHISELASLGNVINIEPWTAPELYDERGSQIIAGELSPDGKEARGPGYLAWLQSRGFGSRFGFAIDITDTGMDRGSALANNLHPDFLDASGQSRVVYARDYTSELDPGDAAGHGTINMSIAGGANSSSASAMRDSSGFNHGLGVAPFAMLGSSKIFQSTGRFDLVEPYSKLISEAYRDGARISSNSWGSGTNEYTIDSQEYDTRVRDAVPGQPGNQEIVILFAAGNAGAGGRIGSPGTGKNVISVAASESFRKDGLDGCGVENADADSAHDIAFFSSGGKLNDGRMKPDISAPGTHIQGAASQHPDFDGGGICGLDFGKPYFPTGQTLYTWSSGTSHATPAAAGAAALVRQHFVSRGQEPSAALIKAVLVNTTTYMTGELAAGDLPHPRQGWGLMNTGRAFDNLPKIFVDQTHALSESGQEFVLTGTIADPSQPFRVTLTWTDVPGLAVFAPWVNDLDLQVVVDGKSFAANDFSGDVSQPGATPNTKDNIESVWLPAGTSGTFVVRVRASNIAGDGIPGNVDATDQDFALAVYNGERKDVPVLVRTGGTMTSGGDAFVNPGETASISFSLANASPFALTGGKASLVSGTQGVTVTSGLIDVPDIPSGATRDIPLPFTFAVGEGVACASVIQLNLDVSGQGFVSRVPLTVRVGTASPFTLLDDDVDSGATSWTHGSSVKKKKNRIDTWVLSEKRSHSGSKAWFTPNLGKITDAFLDTPPLAIPANGKEVLFTFFHTYEFEPGGFDGGVIEISSAGGKFEDLGGHIIKGGYNGEVQHFVENALKSRPAWISGRHGQFQPVVIDLTSFAGQTVVIRFRIGTDDTIKGLGWYVDDIKLDGISVSCGN